MTYGPACYGNEEDNEPDNQCPTTSTGLYACGHLICNESSDNDPVHPPAIEEFLAETEQATDYDRNTDETLGSEVRPSLNL